MGMACVPFPFFCALTRGVYVYDHGMRFLSFFICELASAVCMIMECVSFFFCLFFSRARARCVYEHGVRFLFFFFLHTREHGMRLLSFFFRALARAVCMIMA